MSVQAQAVEAAIVTGAIYASVGVGFALLFRASRVLSFCQGGFMLIGSFVFYDFVNSYHFNFILALAVTVLITSAFSAAMYFFVFARTAAREAFTTSVATIGLAGVLTAVVALKFGTTPLTLPDVVKPHAYRVLSAVVPNTDIIAVVMTLVLISALLLMLKFTPIGLRMKAVADSPGLSVHLGISASRVATVAWALAGASAAFAGTAFALGSSVDPVGVSNVGLFAFPAIILGGLDSIGGVLLGGLILGFIQQGVQLTLGSGWVDIVSFLLMLAVLWVRPSGLFGKADVVRV